MIVDGKWDQSSNHSLFTSRSSYRLFIQSSRPLPHQESRWSNSHGYSIPSHNPSTVILRGITFRRWAWSTLTEDDSVKRHPLWDMITVFILVIDFSYINWLYGVMDTINYYGIISMITPSFLGTEMILANHLDISPLVHILFQIVNDSLQ